MKKEKKAKVKKTVTSKKSTKVKRTETKKVLHKYQEMDATLVEEALKELYRNVSFEGMSQSQEIELNDIAFDGTPNLQKIVKEFPESYVNFVAGQPILNIVN